jgi:His-Xaa-Ser system protein HxsD
MLGTMGMDESTARPMGSDPSPTFLDGSVRTRVDLRCYRLSAVQKTSYRLADKCTVILGVLDGDSLPITITFPSATAEGEALATVRLFYQELLDQELREKIGQETGPLRALLLAHAFSKTDLIRRE